METSRSPHDPVVVPTSEENLSAPHTNSAPASGVSSSSDGVDAMQFFRSLVPVCDKLDLRWVWGFCFKNDYHNQSVFDSFYTGYFSNSELLQGCR